MYTLVERCGHFWPSIGTNPFIMCEYSHAMGASCGGLTDYTEYAYQEPPIRAASSRSIWTMASLLPGTEDRPA